MASGASGEVIHCPNCKEDVPKTLYCLNCGYPLYKDEQLKEEEVVPNVNIEQVKPVEEDTVLIVDEDKETKKPEEQKMETPSGASLEIKEEVKFSEEPVNQQIVEPEVKKEVTIGIGSSTPLRGPTESTNEETREASISAQDNIKIVEKVQEVTKVEVLDEKPVEVVPIVIETPSVEAKTLDTIKAHSEILSKEAELPKIETVEQIEDSNTSKTSVPDPFTKDLMENFAKNISLKLKIIKLYREGALKEETFTKLFEKYVSEGKLWSSRRNEILNKLTDEMEEMESAYQIATEALEFLEVRRSIGESSAGEYEAKAPAYKWDIDNFDNVIGEKRNKVRYMENISNTLTDNELKELRELAGTQYNTLESLQVSKDEFLAVIKENLYEAIKILG